MQKIYMPFHQPQHIFSFLFPSSSSSSSLSFVKHRINIRRRLIALTLSLPWHCAIISYSRQFLRLFFLFICYCIQCLLKKIHIRLAAHFTCSTFLFLFHFRWQRRKWNKFNCTSKRQSEINWQMEILLLMGDRKSFARQKFSAGRERIQCKKVFSHYFSWYQECCFRLLTHIPFYILLLVHVFCFVLFAKANI